MRAGKKILLGLFVTLVVSAGVRAQDVYKEEMRSAWVATVANIDWPKYEHRNKPAEQQAELIRMLEQFRSLNMNAIFLQVRPECDALYQSNHEPWSRYLTWAQGDDPGYDPLQFALEEAHKRGIELHVWLNPYRINASTSDGGDYYHSTHIYSEHPEWAIEYVTGKKILNPGRPEVMSYIGFIVRDIVSNYPVDGVHFDDYFYSYNGTPVPLDADEYAAYGNGMSLGDWRRDNVNRMIDTVYRVIQEVNPSIRFGVSPFGIYRNGVPSGIIGLDAYSTIYCDPLAWLRDGNIDYLTPQTYWPTGGHQDFETLVNWWADSLFHYGRHLYPGQATYRLGSDPDQKKSTFTGESLHELKWYMDLSLSRMEDEILKGTGDPVAPWTLGQIGVQIDIIRSNHDKNGLGSVLFSAKDMDRVNGLQEYLKDNKYLHPTLVPEMSWKPDDTPATPQNVRIEIIDDTYFLLWDFALSGNQRIAVYMSDGETDASLIIQEPSFLQGTYFDNQVSLSELVIFENSRIVVTAISATGREGIPSEAIEINVDMPLAELIAPNNGDTVALTDLLQWDSDLTTPQYQVQISSNSSFSNLVYTSPWTAQQEVSIDSLELDGETKYFWRVRAKETVSGPYTAARSFFTGYPVVPELISPENLALNVSTTPTIRWNDTPANDEILVQVSDNSAFNPVYTEETFTAGSGQGVVSMELEKESWYYVRIKGANEFGTSLFSGFNTFQTTAGQIPYVELISPADQDTVASFDLLNWRTSATEGTVTYQLEVAVDEDFSGIFYKSDWMSEVHIVVSELKLEGKREYFWRVKGKSEFGESDYTGHRRFTAGYPTRPIVTKPAHLSEGVSAKPEVGWSADPDSDSIYVEFSEEADFSLITHAETMDAKAGSATISASLRGFTWYYCQIQAINGYGSSVFSAKKYFMTGEGTAVEPVESDQKSLIVYPTPFISGALHISFQVQNSDPLFLQVIGPVGQEVLRQVLYPQPGLQTTEICIDHNRFPAPGIYYIVVNYQDNLAAQPIIVN